MTAAVRVVLVGGAGRMGRHITELLHEAPRFTVVREVNGADEWTSVPTDVDVVIDFSRPPGLAAALTWCLEHGVALVSGTTGFDEDFRRRLIEASRNIPILYSANMSPGIAAMTAMLDHFARLNEWDYRIDEIHHKQKQDAPSGTALLLDAKMRAVLGRPLEIPNSIRGGTVPGMHQVWAMGPDEVLLLQHTALDRRVFARGAIVAAGWLFDKGKPGFYELKDLYK